TATSGMTVAAGAYHVSVTGTSNSIAGATTFNNTGTLILGDDVGDTINFTGGVTNTAGTTTVHGRVNTANNNATFAAVTLAGNSVISTFTGVGNIQIGSISGGGNSLQLISGSGTTTVTGSVSGLGTLTLQQNDASSTGTVSFQGDLEAAALTTFARNYAVIFLGNSTVIANAVIFNNTGGVTLGDAPGDSIHFSAGPSSISAGVMTVIGTVSATGGLNINGTAVLTGTGTINGKVTTAGSASVSPGPSTGLLTINNGANAALQLGAGTTFTAQVNGTIPGTEHDQLKVTGEVDLTGAVLDISGTIVSLPGQVVVLIDNDGSDPVIGTFAGRPEGSLVNVNGIDFAISYKGGSLGNHVVLIQPGDATFGGTADDDSFLLQQVTIDDVDFLQLYRNNALVYQTLASTVASVTVDGLDGNDTLTVKYDASGGFFAKDISFLADDSAAFPGDQLIVVGGTFATATYNFTGIAEGNLILVTESSATATITYTGLESVNNNSTSGDIVYNLRNLENPDVALADNADPGRMELTGSTFANVTFAAPASSLVIQGGGLADSIRVGSVDSSFRASLTIDGGDGSDTIQLDADLSLGSATSAGDLTLTAETINSSAASISTNGGAVAGNVRFNGTLALGGNVTITAGTGNVDFGGAVSIGARNLTVLSSATTTVSAGIAGSTGSVDINATAATHVDGAIALSGAGEVALDRVVISGVNVTTVGGGIVFDGPTSTDTGAVVIGTGAGAGNVTFNGSLTLGGNVAIAAGAGNVGFVGAVSIGTHDLQVTSSTTTNVSAGIAGSTGSVDIKATIATNVDGAIALSGAGEVRLDRAVVSGVNVTTVGGNITFDGPASTDSGPVAVSTGAGGGDVVFHDTLGLGGNLMVTAGTGNATFSGAVTIGGHSLTVTSSAVTTIAAGISGTTGNVDIAAATRTDVDGAIALSGAGNIELDRATISGVDITTVGGEITFDGPTGSDNGAVEVGTGAGGGH
ncbi:MAG: hypothetical protein KJ000_29655, partial [Pirellulaceae bacterium]|nr:hypothetical protein [Pirellulaceae bacterium]